MDNYILGTIFFLAGAALTVRNPRIWLNLKRGKVRGIAGPLLAILGLLIITGVLPGID